MLTVTSVRHIKCDEASVICNNCTSTGRKCDGYDISRLPMRKLSTSCFSVRPDWVTTNDERRCFAYFQSCSLPNLGLAFNSSLWQKTVLRISQVDPAVYHAAIVLGTIYEDSVENRMRLAGENLHQARHRFALEQSSRAYAFLSHRQASQDPQLREVLLVCCLLFVISELLLGRVDKAVHHLHSGLRMIRETPEHLKTSQRYPALDPTLVETFQKLDAEGSHFRPGTPSINANHELDQDWLSRNVFSDHRSVEDVHKSVTMLMNEGIPFLARCWPLSKSEIAVSYGELSNRQQQLLSLYLQFEERFHVFKSLYYENMPRHEQRAVDLLQIQCFGQKLGLKTCLIKGPIPTGMTPEYLGLLSIHESFLEKFSERPSFTLDYGIIPGLWVVASQCPLYSVRIQAIKLLQSWPHVESFKNSNVAASLALEIIKRELQTGDDGGLSVIDECADGELTNFLSDTLRSTQCSENWSFIRAYNILEQRS